MLVGGQTPKWKLIPFSPERNAPNPIIIFFVGLTSLTSVSNHLLPAFGPQGLFLLCDGPERRIPPACTHLHINEGLCEGRGLVL